MHALSLETICRTMYKAYLIGTPQPLPEGVMGDPGEPARPERAAPARLRRWDARDDGPLEVLRVPR